jgi:hypothetical protein
MNKYFKNKFSLFLVLTFVLSLITSISHGFKHKNKTKPTHKKTTPKPQHTNKTKKQKTTKIIKEKQNK